MNKVTTAEEVRLRNEVFALRQAIRVLESEITKLETFAGAGMSNMRGASPKYDDLIGPGSHVFVTGLECPSCGEQIKIGGTHYCKNYCSECGADTGAD